MNNNFYAVIMAGGVGSRFWPVSTQQYPKQFHDMLGTGQSLIQKTFERIHQIVPSKNILIATNKKYEDLVIDSLTQINKSQLLLEPTMRNTAPCILYSALKIYNQNKNGVLLVAPSDHWIENENEFIKNIQLAFENCASNDILMTLGIKPNAPNTGYGYIEFEKNNTEIKKVISFREKPDLETAKQFIQTNKYLWNAGIFVWSAKSIIKAFEQFLPEMFALFNQGEKYWNTALENDFINENYEKSQNISIDFGIMEQANNVHVLPVDFGWNDLGTWGSLYDKVEKDENNNAVISSDSILINSQGNMIKTQSGKRVVIQGLNDYIVVEKDDVLLICPRKDEQDIKNITSKVKDKFGEDFV